VPNVDPHSVAIDKIPSWLCQERIREGRTRMFHAFGVVQVVFFPRVQSSICAICRCSARSSNTTSTSPPPSLGTSSLSSSPNPDTGHANRSRRRVDLLAFFESTDQMLFVMVCSILVHTSLSRGIMCPRAQRTSYKPNAKKHPWQISKSCISPSNIGPSVFRPSKDCVFSSLNLNTPDPARNRIRSFFPSSAIKPRRVHPSIPKSPYK